MAKKAALDPELESRLQVLIDAISDAAIYMLDAQGFVASWNTGAERVKGYRAEEIIGEHFARFFTEEDRRQNLPQRTLAQAARLGSIEEEGWRVRKDGSRFWATSVVHAIRDDSGMLTGFAKLTRDQTERQQAQDALRESERRFRALVDGVSDYAIFMLDPNGIVTNWNAGAERIKGYKADEIVGHHFSEFYTREDRLAGVPTRNLERALREGRVESVGWRVRKDGSRFLANVVLTPVHDENGGLMGFAKVTRDVTEREQAQSALRDTEHQLRLLLSGIVDHAIYMLDLNGTITSWNAGAERIKGYTADEIIGEHFSRFYTEADRSQGLPARALHVAATTGRYEFQGWRVRKDGSQFWANIVIDAIRDDAGVLIGYAKITRDISQSHEMELALQRTREQLAHAQKIEALGRLTGGIAHDFNNILTVVGGQASILGHRLNDPRDRSALQAIADATQRGETLTRQMLTFSRQQRLEPKVIQFGTHVEVARGLLKSSLGPNTIIATSIAAELWPIEVDTAVLDLALLNLVINARDAMPEGGIITIVAENVTLARGEATPELEGDFVAIAVADTGHGIPEDILPKVFDPFFTTKDADKGTGLGLSQVYGFAHQSGGGVSIRSALGKGTTVTLYFPRSTAMVPHTDTAATAVRHGEGRVLVVDDNPDVANVSAAMLEQLGYRVKTTNSATAALNELKKGGFDLVFSDIVMPGALNGIGLARKVRELYPDLAVVLATGYSDAIAEVTKEFPILRKPFSEADLAREVAIALAPRAENNLIPFPGTRK